MNPSINPAVVADTNDGQIAPVLQLLRFALGSERYALRIDAVRAGSVERELGSDRVVERLDGAIVVRVPASNLPAFRSWVLGLLDHAVVLEPDHVRSAIVEWLRAMVDGTPT